MKYPSISIIIPAFNEETNLIRLYASLKRQSYPGEIEYILVNDSSFDETVTISKKFGARIINVKTHDIELNKGIGLSKAKNDLVYWLDADMEVCSDNFFYYLARPLVENTAVIASFTKEFALDSCSKKVNNSLLRFISYHPLQQDPLYAFFSPSIEGQIVIRKKNYSVCKFVPGKIPAVGRILYRRRQLLKTEVGKDKSFIDMEAVETVVRSGYELFAYVPEAKIRHYHAGSLKELIRKRLRNLQRDYLPNFEHKHFTWFDTKSPYGLLKILFWVIYANLIFPELVRGLFFSAKHKDLAFLWQPVVAITTTDAILWGFLSNKKGRKIAKLLISNFFHR